MSSSIALRVIARRAAQLRAAVANLLAYPLVADRAGRLFEFARRVLLIAARLVGNLFEILLQLADLRVHRLFALREVLRLLLPVGAGLRTLEAVDVRGDLLLLVRQRFGLLAGRLDVALRAIALVALEFLLRLAQLVERRRGLRAAVTRSVRRRLPHGLRRVAHLLGRVRQILTLLLARQLLQPPRGLLEFVGELTLAAAATAAAVLLARGRHPALTLGFLLLAPREVLQLLGEFVHFLVARLLLGALLHLVLVRELVELELEQVREIFGELALAAAATAAATLANLHLVILLGVLQQLQRALLGRERFLRLLRLEVAFGRLHLGRRLRQRLGDGLEARIHDADARLELADQFVHLRAQLRLREVEEHDVLAVFLGGQLRLVAHRVERRRDDLPLLLRQLPDARHRRRPRRRRACDCAGLKSLRNGRTFTK